MPDAGIKRLKYRGVMQSLASLAKEEGARSLYRGNLANVLRLLPFTFTHIAAFDATMRLHAMTASPSPSGPAGAAGAAGA